MISGRGVVFTLSFDRQARVLMASVSGVFSSDDIAGLDAAVPRFVSREGPVRGILDFTDATALAVSNSRIAARGQKPAMVEALLIVAPQPEFNSLGRAFGQYQRMAGTAEPKVVGTLEEAYAILGIVDPQFEPVEG